MPRSLVIEQNTNESKMYGNNFTRMAHKWNDPCCKYNAKYTMLIILRTIQLF